MKNGFTLIELLIVIGILAILVVTILITLNPSEAQKKARDVKRMKDIAALQAIVLQWTQDGNAPICTNWCVSETAGPQGGQSQPCNNNWLNVNLCNYTNSVPIDPANGQTRTYVGWSGTSSTTGIAVFDYQLRMNGSDYKIIVRQESKSNINNIVNNSNWPYSNTWVVGGSDLTLQ